MSELSDRGGKKHEASDNKAGGTGDSADVEVDGTSTDSLVSTEDALNDLPSEHTRQDQAGGMAVEDPLANPERADEKATTGSDNRDAIHTVSTEDALKDLPRDDTGELSHLEGGEQVIPNAGSSELDIPSTWDGAEGGEPDAGKSVDDIKSDAVALRPKDGLQVGEYAGGFEFDNDPRNPDDEKLPETTPDGQPIDYREYDRYPYDGIDRGSSRFVVGSDGTHYSTDDHYKTFTRFR